MKKRIPKVDRKHFEGQRTGVTFNEIHKWLELWPTVRSQVTSNTEACSVLSTMGFRNRDARTVQSYMGKLLPLINTKPISAIIELMEYCESRLPLKEFMRIIQERLPVEELGVKFSNLVNIFVKELPPPAHVIQAFGSILSGGFPFDVTRLKKQ